MINQTAQDFLIANLNRLSKLFPEIHIRYEIRAKNHIIEVVPVSVFENDENYLKSEMIVEKQFEKLFPNEEIIFISENSLTKIKNAKFEFGKDQMSFDVGILVPNTVVNYSDPLFSGNINYALAA